MEVSVWHTVSYRPISSPEYIEVNQTQKKKEIKLFRPPLLDTYKCNLLFLLISQVPHKKNAKNTNLVFIDLKNT